MKVRAARAIARRAHADQLTRAGEPMFAHVERVAQAVAPAYRALAYLHDVPERSDLGAEELYEHELTDSECDVLELLTHDVDDSYARYVTRIARAGGRAGRAARAIKLADLDDHLRHRRRGFRAPRYGWARAQILAAQHAQGEGTPRRPRVGEAA